jgi:serine/threonine protein kinase/HD-like signal output (HDOD) protein
MAPHGSASGSGGPPLSLGTSTLVGTTIGPYKVVGVIGAGGMGRVYQAEHTFIGRKAAIKVLGGDVAPGEDAVSRFVTEARAVNQIRHPNIVEVTDYGTVEGSPYIVMEYLEGETLADRIERDGLLDPEPAVHIARQVASALNAAHEKGMVHRDLKPANIFLSQHADYPDFVKVLDFGIAKLIGPRVSRGHHTKVGALLGTPPYMSPEQCLGEASLDHRSDIYSLGVVIYLMLTGQLPFEDDSVGRLILSHVNVSPRSPRLLRSSLPVSLSDALMKALEKRPQDRWPTMRDFRRALDASVGFQRPTASLGPLPSSFWDGADGPSMAGHSVDVPPRTAAARVRQEGQEDALVAKLTDLVSSAVAGGRLALPQMPRAAAACLASVRRPGATARELAATLSADADVSHRLLRLVDRASDGLRPGALEAAIDRLGADGLERTLVQLAARPVLEPDEPRIRASLDRPWQHALAVAALAERLTLALGRPELSSTLYLAGLLHDIGRPIVAGSLLAVERRKAVRHGTGWLTEGVWLRTIEGTFRVVSAAVAEAWRLSPSVARAVRRSGDSQCEGLHAPAAILAHAIVLANREGFALRPEDYDDVDLLVQLGRRGLGLDEGTELEVVAGVRDRVLQAAELTRPGG